MTTLKTLCITTKYRTLGELIERLHPFCDDSSLFVATRTVLRAGERRRFALRYADHSYAMQGYCTVQEAWLTDDNPFGRPGMRLELSELTLESQVVFDALAAHRRERDVISMSPPLADDTERRPSSQGWPGRQAARRSAQITAPVRRAIPRAMTDAPTERLIRKHLLTPRAGAPVAGRVYTPRNVGRRLALPLPPPPTPEQIPVIREVRVSAPIALGTVALRRASATMRAPSPGTAVVHEMPTGVQLPMEIAAPSVEPAAPLAEASSVLPVFEHTVPLIAPPAPRRARGGFVAAAIAVLLVLAVCAAAFALHLY